MPRPRKSVDLHVVSGTFRSDRHGNRREPQATGPLPQQPPRHLAKAARAAWRELFEAAPLGVLKNCDAALFEAAAVTLASYRRWLREAEAAPAFDESGGALRTHPAHGELRRQRAALQEALTAIGFAPAARLRLVADDDDTLPTGWHNPLRS
jgi:P27 family predicted phage terminase small subunit